MEKFITGYCRCIDKSRIVLVEDGEADCEYANCPYKQNCEIGKQIPAILDELFTRNFSSRPWICPDAICGARISTCVARNSLYRYSPSGLLWLAI